MYYKHHIFFCTNIRDDGRKCCQDADARNMRDYAKARTKELKLAKPGGVRVNIAGCMNRCQEGPVAVVYPEGVWYRYKNKDDIDRIIENHLMKGQVVEDLKI
jgi:(2Fe-2S) ferredoxin